MIEALPENARRLLEALLDARLGTAALTTPEDVLANEITIFNDYVRIDVQTSTPGLQFEQAWHRRELMTYQGEVFYVVSLQDLIASKSAAGCPVDLDDVRLLQLKANDEATS